MLELKNLRLLFEQVLSVSSMSIGGWALFLTFSPCSYPRAPHNLRLPLFWPRVDPWRSVQIRRWL